jgi:hypothetical protein
VGRSRGLTGTLAVLVVALATMAAGCEPVGAPSLAALAPRLDAAFMTRDGQDTYALTAEGDGADMVVTTRAAETNRGRSVRLAFWPVDGVEQADQESCATWSDNTAELRQPGAALRIRDTRGRMQAITVTMNVWPGTFWNFNVHLMDSAADPIYTLIAQADLAGTLIRDGVILPYPWRLCARAVGDVVSFKVWPLVDPEPAWGDPAYGTSVRLPAGWEAPGQAGWYIGHLEPGQSMRFRDLSVTERG